MKQLFIPALLALLIAGCSSTPETGAQQNPADVEGRGFPTLNPPDVTNTKLPPELRDPKNILSKREVFFDYDSFEIKPEYKDLVAAHAKFLTNNRQFKILIQGNTDERGSREYNVALGQKRADAVRKAMSLLGVREEQIESVSLGKEKPSCIESTEACWAKNRRGVILYSGE